MRRWFRSHADPKEIFPIENLPIEVYGDDTSDTLHLLYRRTGELDPQKRRQLQRKHINLDKEKEKFFRRILPILDGFDNIFRYAEQHNVEEDEKLSNWINTLEILYRRLLSALEKEGLVAIESVGKPLDLSCHEVIEVRDVPDVTENIVVEEIIRGYQYGNRILRDAKVIVARKSG